MDPDQQLRNLRDFLLVYNRMTEICFQRCSSNFNYRNLTMDEERCVDSCAGKLIRSNHRLMATYVQLMPRMVQRRMEEMETKAKAAEAAASGVSETPISASPPPVLSPSAGVDNPVELDAAVSKPSTVPEVTLAAATALTPTADALNPVALDRAGPSIAGFSQPSIHTGPAHAVVPSEPTSFTADVPVLTVSAPVISKPTDSLSAQERAPTHPPPSSS